MKLFIFFMLMFTSVIGEAAKTVSTMEKTITNILMYSIDDTTSPDYMGLTEIFFETDIDWGGGNCAKKTVLVRNTDAHILSLILASKIASIPVKVYADDNARVGTTCYLRAITAM